MLCDPVCVHSVGCSASVESRASGQATAALPLHLILRKSSVEARWPEHVDFGSGSCQVLAHSMI